MNQQVKDLIQKLGEAIHESVSESDNISGVVKEIREQGFDVLLMLEATIGLNEVSEESEEVEAEDGDEAAVGSLHAQRPHLPQVPAHHHRRKRCRGHRARCPSRRLRRASRGARPRRRSLPSHPGVN